MRKYVIRVSDQNQQKQRGWLEVEGLYNLRRENKDADQLRSSGKSPLLNNYNYFMLKHLFLIASISEQKEWPLYYNSLSLSLSLSLSKYIMHEHKQNFKEQVLDTCTCNIWFFFDFFFVYSVHRLWVLVKTASLMFKRVPIICVLCCICICFRFVIA